MLIDSVDLRGKAKVADFDNESFGVGEKHVFGFDVSVDQIIVVLKYRKAV
jgi:hypothetical protein